MDMIEKAGKETKTQKLTPKQERFIIEYIKCNEGKKAAVLSGYKESNAYSTASTLLKNPIISQEIARQKALLHKGLLKDRSTFLVEVENLKALCMEKGRVGELIKLLTLEASVLGIDKRDVSVQTTNIFNTMDTAKAFLNGFKDTNAEKAHEGSTQAEIVEPSPITTQATDTTQMGGEDKDTLCTDTISTLSGEVIDIPFETGGGGKG